MHEEHTNWPLMGVTLLLVAGGAAFAWIRYAKEPVPVTPPEGNALTVAARNDLYQDAVNQEVFERPGQELVKALTFTDTHGVDGVVGGVGGTVAWASATLRKAQNGYARTYALTMLTGVVAVLGVLWVMN